MKTVEVICKENVRKTTGKYKEKTSKILQKPLLFYIDLYFLIHENENYRFWGGVKDAT